MTVVAAAAAFYVGVTVGWLARYVWVRTEDRRIAWRINRDLIRMEDAGIEHFNAEAARLRKDKR